MVEFSKMVRTVNGMSDSRRRGYGLVKGYLESIGVPRSDGYRWEKDLRWWHECGPEELAALRAERAKLEAEVAVLRETQGRALVTPSPERVWALIVEAGVLGTSDEEIAELLWRAFKLDVSHQYVADILALTALVGSLAYERYFEGVVRVGSADEIYLGSEPLLLIVESLSLLIGGLRLAEGRGAEDWKPVFARARQLKLCSADEAKGLRKARQEAGVGLQGDMRHLLTKGWSSLGALAQSYEALWKAEQAAEQEVERARFCGGKKRGLSASSRLRFARAKADGVLAEYCRLDDLMREVAGAFAYTTAEGRVATAAAARERVSKALAAMRQSPEGERLAKKLRGVEQPSTFAFLEVVEKGLAGLNPEPGGPERAVWLGRLVGDTLAWRRKDKTPVECLAKASTGSLADEAELTVLRMLDEGIRSSSYVECVNSRVRIVQAARKRMSKDFLCLLAVHHNMKRFGRGSVREGWRPAELAGIQLPTQDWLELLKMIASELGVSLVPAALPA
jgi:hypothetical protein